MESESQHCSTFSVVLFSTFIRNELLIKGLPIMYNFDMAIKELCGY